MKIKIYNFKEKFQNPANDKEKMFFDKKNIAIVILSTLACVLVISTIIDYNNKTLAEQETTETIEQYESDKNELNKQISNLNSEIIEKNNEIAQLKEKVKQAKPWFDMKEEKNHLSFLAHIKRG